MRTLTALFIATLVIVFTFTSVPAIFGGDAAFAQQSATDVQLVKDAPKETTEAKKQPVDFLKDLGVVMRQGCAAFYLYMGWEKHESESLICATGAY